MFLPIAENGLILKGVGLNESSGQSGSSNHSKVFLIVSSVSSYFGYHAKGGAIAVGKSSTEAVVYSSIIILVFNFILTRLILA